MPLASGLVKITEATAAAVCRHMRLADEVRPLLHAKQTPLEFLDVLVAEDGRLPSAVDFLGHALPRREAVWWGCLCVWREWGPQLSVPEQQALFAAVGWVLEPTEDHRQGAGAAAKAVHPLLGPVNMSADPTDLPTDLPDSAAGHIAQAVFESGGSLLPSEMPVIEPHPGGTASSVGNAVHMLALSLPMDEIMPSYRRLVALGIGVALDKYPWPAPSAPKTEAMFWPGQRW